MTVQINQHDSTPAAPAVTMQQEAPIATAATEQVAPPVATPVQDDVPVVVVEETGPATSATTAPPPPPLADAGFSDTKPLGANPNPGSRNLNPPTPPSAAPQSVFTREDENRLTALTQRETDVEETQPLTAAEREELKALAVRYQVFLEEGERRLLEGAAASRGGGIGGGTNHQHQETLRKVVTGTGNALVTAGKGAYFWGTLIGTAVPGYLGKQMGLTKRFDYWNWLSNKLILGALPVVTSVGTSGNHLEQLKVQLEQRKAKLGLVVACLQQEEMQGFGVGVLHFATAEHWKEHLGLEDYEHVPMPDATAQTSYESVKHAIDRMHQTMHDKNEVVYVHCKAGKGRSWMVVMCYLLTYGGMDWNTAKITVESGRHQVSPGHSQKVFAQEFARRFNLEASGVVGATAAASPASTATTANSTPAAAAVTETVAESPQQKEVQ